MYESLKAGHTIALEEAAWKCRLFDITREYWLVIMKDLIDSGYVSGLKYVEKSAKLLEKHLKSFSAVWSACYNHNCLEKHHASEQDREKRTIEKKHLLW